MLKYLETIKPYLLKKYHSLKASIYFNDHCKFGDLLSWHKKEMLWKKSIGSWTLDSVGNTFLYLLTYMASPKGNGFLG